MSKPRRIKETPAPAKITRHVAKDFSINDPLLREAKLVKIIRAMRTYGWGDWMKRDMEELGYTIF